MINQYPLASHHNTIEKDLGLEIEKLIIKDHRIEDLTIIDNTIEGLMKMIEGIIEEL